MRVLVLLSLVVAGAMSDMVAGEEIPAGRYLASTIPPALVGDANAVVRYQSQAFTVADTRRASLVVRKLVTILHPEGRVFGQQVLTYDKFRTIDDLDITLYDAEGKKIRSLESGEIVDAPLYDGFSLYSDNRYKSAELYNDTYPYSVEISYEYSYDGLLQWPAWYPESVGASVESSISRVTIPVTDSLRYWTNMPLSPQMTVAGNRRTYIWEISMLPPLRLEPVGPDASDQQQCVLIAPRMFEIENHPGNLSTWKSFGLWNYGLFEGRQELPALARSEVEGVIRGVADPREKARLLYRFLQQKTRYVSIQLGIGGWQPFDASYVYEKGYGDCKALTNYMMAILKAAGITSFPALISSGTSRGHLRKEFAQCNFNHVILCIPLQADTVWLECTDQNVPFGHIGDSNENRYALVISPDGGTLVRTPSGKAADNAQIRKALVVLGSGGDARAQIQTTCTGNQQDYLRWGLYDATPKEKEQWLREHLDIPVFSVRTSDFFMMSDRDNAAGISLDLDLPRYAAVAGSRLLFQPNLMEKRTYVPPPLVERKFPVTLRYPYLDIDTVTYKFPPGFRVEALPEPVSLETGFAAFHSAIAEKDEGKLEYTRRLEVRVAELPPSKYDEYRKFFQGVVRADKASAAVVRK